MASQDRNELIVKSVLSFINKANVQLHWDCPVIFAINEEGHFKRFFQQSSLY